MFLALKREINECEKNEESEWVEVTELEKVLRLPKANTLEHIPSVNRDITHPFGVRRVERILLHPRLAPDDPELRFVMKPTTKNFLYSFVSVQ